MVLSENRELWKAPDAQHVILRALTTDHTSKRRTDDVNDVVQGDSEGEADRLFSEGEADSEDDEQDGGDSQEDHSDGASVHSAYQPAVDQCSEDEANVGGASEDEASLEVEIDDSFVPQMRHGIAQKRLYSELSPQGETQDVVRNPQEVAGTERQSQAQAQLGFGSGGVVPETQNVVAHPNPTTTRSSKRASAGVPARRL